MTRRDEAAELERLLAQDASPLAPFVEGLRERTPDAGELASLASRLALQGIDVTPPATIAPRAPWKKWVVPGAGGVVAIVAWLGWPSSPSSPVAPAESGVVARASGQLAEWRAPEAEVTGLRRAPEGARSVPSARSLEVPSPVSSAGRALSPPPPAPAPDAVSEEAAQAGVTGESAARATAKTAPRGAAVSSAAERDVPGARTETGAQPSELSLLRDARLALRQAPSRALELTEQHARLYPQGNLAQEREFLAISALAGLGRRTAALARASRFEQAFPSSAYRKQLAELLR
jgi:hypothetical protein